MNNYNILFFRFKIFLLFIFLILIIRPISSENYGGMFGAVYKNEGSANYFASGKSIAENEIDNLYINPAGLSSDKNLILSTTASWMFKEFEGINQVQFAGIIPVNKNIFGIKYSSVNVNDIRAANTNGLTGNNFSADFSALHLSYAKAIKNFFSIAIEGSYFSQSIEKYKLNNFSLSTGLEYKKNDLIIISNIQNIFSTTASGIYEKEKMPLNIELGINYKILNELLIGLFLNKEKEYNNIDYRAGIRYDIFNFLKINGGYINESKQVTAGISFIFKPVSVHYGVLKHPDLDLTHRISLDYEF